MNALRLVLSFAGIVLTATSPFVTASCGKKACFAWTEAEGKCPSQADARVYFDPCSNGSITVDSEPAFDGELCCYDITNHENVYDVCVPPGAGGATSASTVGTAVDSTGTTTFPEPCDRSGLCGDLDTQGCGACAINNVCFRDFDECDCGDFLGCMYPCGWGQSCVDACATQFPEGAQAYNTVRDCVVCTACPIDCADESTLGDPIPGCQ